MASHTRRSRPIAAAAIVALFTIVAVAAALSRKTPLPVPPFRQVTYEADDANSPALSADGQQIAYCVSRIGGKRKIWVQAIEPGPPPRQVTDGAWNDYDPVFSHDGAFVYFTSEREPQGIYRVRAAGGAAELVREGAVTPGFSPDGRWFLFNYGGLVNIMPAEGGTARVLAPSLTSSYAPVWASGSQSILFASGAASELAEWWIASVDGGDPHRTGVSAALAQQGFNYAEPRVWLPGDVVVFAGKKGETMTLWRIGVSPESGTVTHPPARATDDAEGDYRASFAAGRMAFDRTHVGLNLWSLPVDRAGLVQGPPERLTSTANQKGVASLSRDGRTLLFSEEHEGVYSLFLRDLQSAKQREVLSGAFLSALRPDGKTFAYSSGPMDQLDVLSRSAGWWWFSRTLCAKCGVPRGFSPDGRALLLWANSEVGDHVDLAGMSSRHVRTILSVPSRAAGGTRFYSPQLSPDGRAIVFGLRSAGPEFESWMAPLHPDRPTAEAEWTPVMPAGETYHIPFWSADGGLIYILTNHGGGNLKWLEAQPVDGRTLRLTGPRFPIYEFHEPRVPTMDPLWNPVMAVAGRIVIELGDMSTNVWIGDRILAH